MLEKGAVKIRWMSIATALIAAMHVLQYVIAGRPVIAPEQVISDRERICGSCEENDKGVFPQCNACTCIIEAKVMLSSESCPRGYWMSLTGTKKNPKTGALS